MRGAYKERLVRLFSTMTWTLGEKYLAISLVICLCHHIDHVSLRP